MVILLKEDKLKIQDIKNEFGTNKPFTSKELFQFYRRFEFDLNEGTYRWRVYHLKNQGVIRSVARGTYIIDEVNNFNPKINLSMKRIYNHVKRNFPYIDIVIWDTLWLHEFMNHQPFNSLTILEVDKEALDSVFQSLKENRTNIYMKLNGQYIENYISNENVVIVKSIIKSSPMMEVEKINIPKIEKILVDVFIEKDMLAYYQGKELINIFERAYEEYSVNLTTLYRYARNRGIKDKLIDFLNLKTKIKDKYI